MAEELRRNIFILGLDEWQREQLGTVTNAGHLVFHQLLTPEEIKRPDIHGFAGLLDRAREQLTAFDGTVDAVISHWDFPASVLAPMLGQEWGLAVPPLRSVIACEHKYFGRIEQAASIPEVVPAFAGFDPFDDDALDAIDLDYPFWIKPVKAHSSQLGFRIQGPQEFHEAVTTIRAKIATFGDPFNEALAMVELPDHIPATSGSMCVAEQIVSGRQVAPEGSMHAGEFSVHGIIDMPKDDSGFTRYEYPAAIPEDVRERMSDASERYLRHIGFDDGCFNAEFVWDEDTDALWLIEVNTRISQSHSNLFTKVDGMSNHEVAIDVALGRRPFMPDRRGNFGVAAKCFLWTQAIDDGVVRRVPSQQEIAQVSERFPDTHVEIEVSAGDRLSELRDQNSYRYELATLYIGAQEREDLDDYEKICRKMLPFEIDRVEV